MEKTLEVRKTNSKTEKVKISSKMSPEELLKVFANIIVDRVIQEHQAGTLRVKDNSSG